MEYMLTGQLLHFVIHDKLLCTHRALRLRAQSLHIVSFAQLLAMQAHAPPSQDPTVLAYLLQPGLEAVHVEHMLTGQLLHPVINYKLLSAHRALGAGPTHCL
jgi:hypothetical protein